MQVYNLRFEIFLVFKYAFCWKSAFFGHKFYICISNREFNQIFIIVVVLKYPKTLLRVFVSEKVLKKSTTGINYIYLYLVVFIFDKVSLYD